MSFVGTPNYGGAKRNTYKLKDGDNLYRVLPPCGTFAAEGRFFKYESVHWGYKGSNGWTRNFRCPLQTKGKGKDRIVVKACAECDLIAQRKATYDSQLKSLVEGQGVPEKAAREQLKPLADWLFSHNRDSKVYLNVQTLNGEIGRLAIPNKSLQALQLAIGDVMKKAIDPIRADQGVYYNFNRTGTGTQTIHRVTVVTEEFTPPGSTEKFERIKRAPLTEETLKRMEKEAYDLSDMFRTVSNDDVARLVASGGEAEVVDSVFSSPEASTEKSTPGMGAAVGTFFVEPEEDDFDAEAAVATTTVVTAAPAAAPVATGLTLDQQIAALVAQKAQLASAAVMAPTVTVATPAAPVTPTQTTTKVSSKSTEEFLKEFGIGKS